MKEEKVRGEKIVDKNMTIGRIIVQKGEIAGRIIDQYLCSDEGKICCPSTTLMLGYAAELKGQSARLPVLLEELNLLPDFSV